MTTFSDILDEPASLPEPPKQMPIGHYICTVKGQPNHEISPKSGTPMTVFTLQFVQAEADVDKEDLKEVLTKKDGSTFRLSDKSIRLPFYLTPAAKWRLEKFLSVDLGIPIKGKSKGMQEAEAEGKQVRIYVKHTLSQDLTTTFANVERTYKIQEDV